MGGRRLWPVEFIETLKRHQHRPGTSYKSLLLDIFHNYRALIKSSRWAEVVEFESRNEAFWRYFQEVFGLLVWINLI